MVPPRLSWMDILSTGVWVLILLHESIGLNKYPCTKYMLRYIVLMGYLYALLYLGAAPWFFVQLLFFRCGFSTSNIQFFALVIKLERYSTLVSRFITQLHDVCYDIVFCLGVCPLSPGEREGLKLLIGSNYIYENKNKHNWTMLRCFIGCENNGGVHLINVIC